MLQLFIDVSTFRIFRSLPLSINTEGKEKIFLILVLQTGSSTFAEGATAVIG